MTQNTDWNLVIKQTPTPRINTKSLNTDCNRVIKKTPTPRINTNS